MNAARSLTFSLSFSTVALLFAAAVQAQSAEPRYDPDAFKPMFKGTLVPGADRSAASQSGSAVTSARTIGDNSFPALTDDPKLAGEPLVPYPTFKPGVHNPMFTGKMVGSSELKFDAPSAGPLSARAPIAQGKSPVAHANEMAELFRQACLASDGQAERVADWALTQGYVAASTVARGQATQQFGRGADGLNVFVRDAADTSPLLVFSSRPMQCGVVARQSVDATRLRAQLARLAMQWSGMPAPKSLLLDDPADSAPVAGGQLLAYRFNARGQQQTLLTPSKTAAPGAAFIALQTGATQAAVR
jgi:hypothetical protein